MSILKRPLRLVAAALALAAAHASALRAQADTVWSALYLTDLDSAYAFIAANHPGMVDTLNPEFARTLETAYAEARRAADSVRTFSSYRIALSRFGNRLQDEHLSIGSSRPLEGVRDAGIFPVYQGGAFVVADVDERYGAAGERIRGARVVSCGGRPADTLFRERVLSWRGRPNVEADWYRLAPAFFMDYGPPTPPGPASCRFRVGRRTIELALQWAPSAGSQTSQRMRRLGEFEARPLALQRLEGGRVLWVDVPTFAVNSAREVAAMNALIDTLRAEMARRRDWRLLVFDLRGNSGGSSVWGDRIAAAVFGDEWARQAGAWLSDGVYTEYRVSPFNAGVMHELVKQSEQRYGAESEQTARTRALADSMAAALARGARLWGVAKRRQGVPRPAPVAVPGRIVVITSASCFSACLDFLDRMRLHPAVVQVGQTTGVDTNYMENWGTRLPSGLAQIGYPMKVYRNRRRANNEAYPPHVRYEGSLRDTAALRAWILRRFGR